MNRIGELLNKRYAGVPGYVVAVVLVGLLALVAFRLKPSASGTTTAEDAGVGDNTDGVAGDPAQITNPIFVATPPTNVQGQSASAEASAATNDSWGRSAIAWLMANKGASETAARAAIQRYLAGEALSTSQDALKNAAVAQFGLPPELPSGGGVTAPVPFSGPAVKQGKPPTTHTVKGTADNTPTELARLYYGRSDGIGLGLIYAANLGHVPGTPFAIGEKVNVPAFVAPKYVTTTAGMRTADQIASKNSTSGARILALNVSLFKGTNKTLPVGVRVRVR